MSLFRLTLKLVAVVAVIPAIAVRLLADSCEILGLTIPAPEPRKLFSIPRGLFASILVPLDLDALAQNVGRRQMAECSDGHHR